MLQLMSSIFLVGLFILEVALLRMLIAHHTSTTLSKIVKELSFVPEKNNLRAHKDLNFVMKSVPTRIKD
ncbi:hypothetical protein WQ54_13295 [Bacillus sp. SA1-12]|uniref:hypothetical protein n=1 Tax=Bacillus sp. SA1-12 TaxID=1455638 RepID=UPI000625DB1B|nr:hypothetical protein [Bacillus sp. SA1-12]KKI91690.1 hypothetical protein WQ54_13295 [Bacillus sp. SA1-12]